MRTLLTSEMDDFVENMNEHDELFYLINDPDIEVIDDEDELENKMDYIIGKMYIYNTYSYFQINDINKSFRDVNEVMLEYNYYPFENTAYPSLLYLVKSYFHRDKLWKKLLITDYYTDDIIFKADLNTIVDNPDTLTSYVYSFNSSDDPKLPPLKYHEHLVNIIIK